MQGSSAEDTDMTDAIFPEISSDTASDMPVDDDNNEDESLTSPALDGRRPEDKIAEFVANVLSQTFPPDQTFSDGQKQALAKDLGLTLRDPGFLGESEKKRVVYLEGRVSVVLDYPDREAFTRLATTFLEDWSSSSFEQEGSYRMVPIDYEIADIDLSHQYDINYFTETILGVADQWNRFKHARRYVAPYFCFVQSSGMGKTKLMFEFANRVNNIDKTSPISCDLVVCTEGLVPTNNEVFSLALDFEQFVVATKKNEAAKDIAKEVHEYLDQTFIYRNSTLRKNQKMKRTHIIMFDEAQFLLKDHFREQAFLFRCIRTWLRAKKVNKNHTVVAVFAGTSSTLTNFNVLDDEKLQVTTTSREISGPEYYEKGTHIFPPFMCTTTMGVLFDADRGAQTEYGRAIGYGRPLFAVMQRNDVLHENIVTILHRLLLTQNDDRKNWKDEELSWLSVLATRVQMGSTSMSVTAELVARGYANLISVSDMDTATFAYLPDPVCARLAMCMMDEESKFPYKGISFQGQTKTWWVTKVKELYSSGLCRPDKGDVGEVLVALYFLFCGDECRRLCVPNNIDYFTFSVPLCSWIDRMLLGESGPAMPPNQGDKQVHTEKDAVNHMDSNNKGERRTRRRSVHRDQHTRKPPKTYSVDISFIQVCRNCLRHFGESWATFADQEFLGHLYAAGTAFYMYPGCPLIDMAAPMRITKDNEVSYGSLLISIKSRKYFAPGSAEDLCIKMQEKADKYELKSTLCLVVVFGQEKNSDDKDMAWNTDRYLIPVVHGANMSAVIRLPYNDRFELTSTFNNLTSFGKPELLETHSFIRALSMASKDGMFKDGKFGNGLTPEDMAEFKLGLPPAAHKTKGLKSDSVG